MSIRFKFRSSVSFDSVDIGGQPSISVRELRSKIIRHKNLNLCQDFDLVFSDPVTGQDYNDESFQIPSNSSVIIKRVPAGSVPSALPIGSVEKLGKKSSNILGEKSEEMDDFDDFGIDLCPVPEEIFPYSDLEVDKKNEYNNEKTTIAGERTKEAMGIKEFSPRMLYIYIYSSTQRNEDDELVNGGWEWTLHNFMLLSCLLSGLTARLWA